MIGTAASTLVASTLNTINTHVRNIYAKLDARDRSTITVGLNDSASQIHTTPSVGRPLRDVHEVEWSALGRRVSWWRRCRPWRRVARDELRAARRTALST